MEIMESLIDKHNMKITRTEPSSSPERKCNCREKYNCPLNNNCLSTNFIYNALVTTHEDKIGKNYICLTEFKQRFSQHKLSLRNENYANSNELSRYILEIKYKNKDYNIKWTIIRRARQYNNIIKWCDLCLTEKLCIIKAYASTLLKKRSELVSKCRHQNKYCLANSKSSIT